MDFLVVSHNNTINNTSIFVQEFCDVLSQGHNVWFFGENPLIEFSGQLYKENTIVPGKYDGAYLNHFVYYPDIDCNKAYFTHGDILTEGLIQNIQNVIDNDSNYKIVINSDLQKQQLLDDAVNSGLLVNLPVYINEYIFKPDAVPKKVERSIILSGMNNYAEQVIPLIKAMKLLPDYRLTIMGEIESKVLREQIETMRNRSINFVNVYTGDEKVAIINKHEIGIGIGRNAEELVLCGLPTLIFNDSFPGYLVNTNIDELENDNFSGRYFEVVDDKVQLIVDAIKDPKPLLLNFAIQRLGMVTNIADYINLTV